MVKQQWGWDLMSTLGLRTISVPHYLPFWSLPSPSSQVCCFSVLFCFLLLSILPSVLLPFLPWGTGLCGFYHQGTLCASFLRLPTEFNPICSACFFSTLLCFWMLLSTTISAPGDHPSPTGFSLIQLLLPFRLQGFNNFPLFYSLGISTSSLDPTSPIAVSSTF